MCIHACDDKHGDKHKENANTSLFGIFHLKFFKFHL